MKFSKLSTIALSATVHRMACGVLVLLSVGWTTAIVAAQRPAAAARVVPIDWKRFDQPPKKSEDYRRCEQLLLNCARYNLGWAPAAADRIEQGWRQLTGRQAHDVIRPACSASYALSVVLKTGIFDEKAVGVSKQEAVARTVRLIKAAAVAHDRASWKYPWQSALWAGVLGHGGWMLWDDLDPETRRTVAAVVEFEANRFLAPGYRVPYWNGKGGDTKAEENAWNAMVLYVASAMMPQHPHAGQWKNVCSELMVSAYALKQDMQKDTVLDGKPLREWLKGYNVRDDGAVINQGIVHPDYMCCVSLSLRAYLTQSLCRRPVPETADFRAEFVYRILAARKWPSPPYKAPGGTIYVPGQAEVYYPHGTDWYKGRLPIYYLMDVYAHLFGWDQGLPRPAAHWMRLRAEKILQKQSRHRDGRLYAAGEFLRFPGREQMSALLIADAFLLHWLHARGAISPEGNWLAETKVSP